MITPVSNSVQPLTELQTPAAKPISLPAESLPTTTDTVQISSAARAALQEAYETPVQTLVEAAAGDLQAKQLLAKEKAAAKAA